MVTFTKCYFFAKFILTFMRQSAILILLYRMMYRLFCNRFHHNASYTVDFARIWMYTTQAVQYNNAL